MPRRVGYFQPSYWAAKRLMDLTDDALRAAMAGALLQPQAIPHLIAVLQQRRRLLVTHAMSVVSPVEIAASVGRSVWLRDRAIVGGVAEARDTHYAIAFLDNDGSERAPRVLVPAAGELTAVMMPKSVLNGLVVLHVRVIRGETDAPRPCDVHVMVDRSSARVIGVRH